MAGFEEIGGFDANKVEPAGDVLPAGDYQVIITKSEWKVTSKGDGRMLNLQLQVLNGPCQNRVLFDRLNLVNPNEKAVQIAKATLSSICRAVGVLTPSDSAQLHNLPMLVKVVVKDSPEFGVQNEIKSYKSRHAGPALPATSTQPAATEPTYQAPATSGQATPF